MNSSHSVHNLRPEIDNRQKTKKIKILSFSTGRTKIVTP